MSKSEIAQQIDEGINEGLDLQEISWCETYLRTASIRQACKESLMDLSSAKDMLRKPAVQAYIISKSLAYKGINEGNLNRADLRKILNNIAQDPTTPPELRISAVSKLNAMQEFDLEHKAEMETEETDEIKITSEEAEKMLKMMREGKFKEEED